MNGNKRDLDQKLDKVHSLSQPQLWSFSLRYGIRMGWHCTIQESHFSGGFHVGMGKSWTEAVDEAILNLEKSKESIK